MNLRLLVFGRTGQLACALRRIAEREGMITVTALGRQVADLRDPEACAAVIAAADADAVINAAAYTAVDKAESEEALAYRINAEAPGVMAQACAARGLPFLHVSTDYVFDGRRGSAWREDDATGPLSAYGRTKLTGEQLVAAAGGPHVILRTAWVFSADGTNFLRTMLRLAATRDRLTVVDDQIGGPTPADAIAAALVAIARARHAGAVSGPEADGIFHFAGTPPVTWCGFARAIMAARGVKPGPVVDGIATAEWPTPAVRPQNSVLDCRRIRAVYGIAQPDWQAALPGIVAAAETDV